MIYSYYQITSYYDNPRNNHKKTRQQTNQFDLAPFLHNSTNEAIKPIIIKLNPSAPQKDIEFATIGILIVIFEIGFHGKPVKNHSRPHKTSVQIVANKIALCADFRET
ncbi:MAG: hypothetical protein IK122_00275 [Alphaproteobacteria bacterium]|nr:hypothetical protein [Alphaproteobacteria bacterium]